MQTSKNSVSTVTISCQSTPQAARSGDSSKEAYCHPGVTLTIQVSPARIGMAGGEQEAEELMAAYRL